MNYYIMKICWLILGTNGHFSSMITIRQHTQVKTTQVNKFEQGNRLYIAFILTFVIKIPLHRLN